MPHIKFIRSVTPHESGEYRPAVGDVIEVNEASAQRWLRRKAAEIVAAPAKPTKPTKSKESK